MSKVANRGVVFFKEALAGEVFEEEGDFVFRYFEDYLESKTASPIAFSFPLQKEAFREKNLFPFFDGLIPEGWLLNIAVKSWKFNPRDRFLLLLHLCGDCIGAVSVRSDSSEKAPDPPKIDFPNFCETNPKETVCLHCYLPLKEGDPSSHHSKCSRKVFSDKNPPRIDISQEILTDLAESLVDRSRALTGVQKKISLGLAKTGESGEKRLTLVEALPGYILKPPSDEFSFMPENEHLVMKMAEICGIQTPPNTLVRLASGELAYLVKRFDRKKKSKLAVEDMGQILGVVTANKYRGSTEKIGKAIFSLTTHKGNEVYRFLEIVLFNFLVGNIDMHLKNYSLLIEEDGDVRLSPAYDFLSVRLLISEKEDSEQTALSINGKKNKLQRRDFLALAQSLQIKEKVFDGIIKDFQKAWPKMSDLVDRSFLPDQQKEQLKRIFEKNMQVIA